jgi:hypothetical protein
MSARKLTVLMRFSSVPVLLQVGSVQLVKTTDILFSRHNPKIILTYLSVVLEIN